MIILTPVFLGINMLGGGVMGLVISFGVAWHIDTTRNGTENGAVCWMIGAVGTFLGVLIAGGLTFLLLEG